jgi:hypothetical protein
VLAGFSPRMNESCWYETNFPNLWRYAKNRMRNFMYDPEADVKRIAASLPVLSSGAMNASAGGPKNFPGTK